MSLDDEGVLLIKSVRSRGWNLYDFTGSGGDSRRGKECLARGPAESYADYKKAVEAAGTLFDTKSLSYD